MQVMCANFGAQVDIRIGKGDGGLLRHFFMKLEGNIIK